MDQGHQMDVLVPVQGEWPCIAYQLVEARDLGADFGSQLTADPAATRVAGREQ